MSGRIRVVSVDDSSVARENYRQILSATPGMELVATAPNADVGRKRIKTLNPDVVILDIDMPGTDGLTFLKWLMRSHPTPVVIASTLEPNAREKTMSAFSLGAIDVVCKGEAIAGDGNWGAEFRERLVRALRAAAKAKPRIARQGGSAVPLLPAAPPSLTDGYKFLASRLVVIGASTGGTEAIAHLVARMPRDFPPVLIVQHMPPLYTESFAERLNSLGPVGVREAAGGEPLETGTAWVAPGGKHLRVRSASCGYVTETSNAPPVRGHRPSVDVLFESAAAVFGRNAVGVLLTGMGSDGAQGLLQIRQAGGHTIAQDEATCVVYGMPKEAVAVGAAEAVLPLERMMSVLLGWLSERRSASCEAL